MNTQRRKRDVPSGKLLLKCLDLSCLGRLQHAATGCLVLALGLAAVTGQASAANSVPLAGDARHPPVTDERLANANRESQNWLSYGRTYDESRYSPLDQINDRNVGRLGLAWSFEFPDNRGLEATPLVVDGVIYTVGAWNRVFALDAKTGELLWQFDPQVPKGIVVRACCGPVSRGLAVWQDKVFVATLDGYLIALDRFTGQVAWRTLTIDPAKDYTITGAPRVVKGRVLIGNSGAEYGVRGYVSAYDAATGALSWRFYTVPGNPANGFENPAMEMAAKTWNGEWWKMGGGGTVWDAMAYDPELNLLYIGVGNGSPWNREIRSPGGGDNLFLSSIVALNPDTGAYVWHYQTTPGESWDFTATQQIILADIPWQGKPRKVLMQAPKNGFFFVIDRVTGELLSAKPYTRVNWAKGYDQSGRPIEVPESRYTKAGVLMVPSAVGGHNWHPMSYHPGTGLVYIPVIKSAMKYQQPTGFDPSAHHQNVGADIPNDTLIDPQFMQILTGKIMRGELVAWDPIRQEPVWTYRHARTWNGGTLATAGNLVFQGTSDHKFMAFNARNGDVLWSRDVRLGVVAAPVTYSIDGEQYIALMAKLGGAGALAMGIEPLPGLEKGRLLVFKLDGRAALPEIDKTAAEPAEPPPLMSRDEHVLAEGKALYAHYCMPCHGNGVIGGGDVPDLRRMPLAFHENFKAIVLGGMLQANGMVSFADVLDDSSADAVHAYILQQAHADYEARQATGLAAKFRVWAYDKLATMMVLAFDRSVPFFAGVAAFWGVILFLVWRRFARNRA